MNDKEKTTLDIKQNNLYKINYNIGPKDSKKTDICEDITSIMNSHIGFNNIGNSC